MHNEEITVVELMRLLNVEPVTYFRTHNIVVCESVLYELLQFSLETNTELYRRSVWMIQPLTVEFIKSNATSKIDWDLIATCQYYEPSLWLEVPCAVDTSMFAFELYTDEELMPLLPALHFSIASIRNLPVDRFAKLCLKSKRLARKIHLFCGRAATYEDYKPFLKAGVVVIPRCVISVRDIEDMLGSDIRVTAYFLNQLSEAGNLDLTVDELNAILTILELSAT